MEVEKHSQLAPLHPVRKDLAVALTSIASPSFAPAELTRSSELRPTASARRSLLLRTDLRCSGWIDHSGSSFDPLFTCWAEQVRHEAYGL